MAEEPEIVFGMPEGGNNGGNAPNGGGGDDPNAHARARGACPHEPTSYQEVAAAPRKVLMVALAAKGEAEAVAEKTSEEIAALAEAATVHAHVKLMEAGITHGPVFGDVPRSEANDRAISERMLMIETEPELLHGCAFEVPKSISFPLNAVGQLARCTRKHASNEVAADNRECGQELSKGEELLKVEGSELRMAAADGSCDGASEEGGARDAAAQALALGTQERACMRRKEPREGDGEYGGRISATSKATWLEGALPDAPNGAESCTNTGSVGSEGQGGCGEEAAEKPCVGCAHELYLEWQAQRGSSVQELSESERLFVQLAEQLRQHRLLSGERRSVLFEGADAAREAAEASVDCYQAAARGMWRMARVALDMVETVIKPATAVDVSPCTPPRTALADAATPPRSQRAERRVQGSPVPLSFDSPIRLPLPADVVCAASADTERMPLRAMAAQPAPLGPCAVRRQRWRAATQLQCAVRGQAALRMAAELRMQARMGDTEEPCWLTEAHTRVAAERLQHCWRRKLLCAAQRATEAAIHLQCGWRCRQARQRAARAQRVAAARMRLAAREAEERAKRAARQERAGSRRVQALFEAARGVGSLLPAMPRPPAAAEHASGCAAQQLAEVAVAAACRQPARSRKGTLQRLVARLALPEAAEPSAREAAARSVQRRWRERRWAIRRLLVATVAVQRFWRGAVVRREAAVCAQLRAQRMAEAAAVARQQAAVTITEAMRRCVWRRWRRVAMAAEAEGESGEEAGAEQCDYWQSVFTAQSELTARMGVGWPQQIERNLEAVRRRMRCECERREARELGKAFAEGWGAQVEALRQQGVRLRVGAGTGGRQLRSQREQRQQLRGDGQHQNAAG